MRRGRGVHLCSWEVVGNLAGLGGLELGNLRVHNRALLAKTVVAFSLPLSSLLPYGTRSLLANMILTPMNDFRARPKTCLGTHGKKLSTSPFFF